MSPSADRLELTLPDGLPAWLHAFVRDALAETTILRQNGAEGAVAARMAVLRKLIHSADGWLNEELDTAAAAQEQGCAEEAIRRAVREGRIPERRVNQKAHIAIRRRDLQLLAAPGTDSYDAIADAQDIARLRRKA
jgi:hypothetical protein